jgi:sugar/nucleoside kinase (ribokinase family)
MPPTPPTPSTPPLAPLTLPDDGRRPTGVVCLGHALVDRLAEATEDVVVSAGLEIGAMTLVDADAASIIEKSHEPWREVAGGSAANTAAGIASLGGSAAFAGSVGADEAGRRYVADLEAAGVRCVAPAVTSGEPSGVCHVFVSPGGDRSMATYLGAGALLGPAAIEAVGVERASILYVEGYLLDAPMARAALTRAIEVAGSAGTLLSLSLSDPFVVERHHEAVRDLLRDGAVDVLFGNHEELLALTGSADLHGALERLTLMAPGLLGFVTRGAAGSVVFQGDARADVLAAPVPEVVDTTGAGDLYAAGVLFGLTNGRDPAAAAEIGSLAAAEVIGHFGARPEVRLADLLGGR